MPTRLLEPHDDFRISFDPMIERRVIQVNVKSDIALYAYIVDGEGLEEYDDGDDFTTFAGGNKRRRNHKLRTVMPSRLRWYLLVVNTSDELALVDWNAFYER